MTLAAVALAACSAEPTPVATEASPSPEWVPVRNRPLMEQPIANWEITFTGIGPFTVNQTAADVAELTGADYSLNLGEPGRECAVFILGEGDLSAFLAMAESGGAHGTVDRYVMWGSPEATQPFPATDDGITIGTTFERLVERYGDPLVVETDPYDDTWKNAWIAEGDYGMLFTIDNNDEVVSITTGRDPQYRDIDSC